MFLVVIGYKGMKEERIKLLPLNRREYLTGEKARKASKQIVTVGLIVTLVGLLFVLTSF